MNSPYRIIFTLQIIAFVCALAVSIIYGTFYFWLFTILLATIALLLYKYQKSQRAMRLQEMVVEAHSPAVESYLNELETLLDTAFKNKMQVIPVLTEQLKAVIAQTDEAADNLTGAFLGINKQAKEQLSAVQGVFGNLSEQSSSNNILMQTQQSLNEIQANFATITSFFDGSIKLI